MTVAAPLPLDHEQFYILTVERTLDGRECAALIERIERGGPTPAPINTLDGPRVRSRVRNNERIMFDDPELAARLFDRIKDRVPPRVHDLRVCGVNERFRCHRYKPGMRFAPHADAAFARDDSERSCYTLIVYLNDGFAGGDTTFLVEPEVSILPVAGKALLFQHPLVHEGALVTDGVKYALRTDVMYRTGEPAPECVEG